VEWIHGDLRDGFGMVGIIAAVAGACRVFCLPFLFSLPFKGVRAACLRGIAAQADRTPGALRRAGRAGVGMVLPWRWMVRTE